MSFTRSKYEVLQRFKDLGKLKRLRTFIAFRLYSSPWGASCYLSNNVLHEALLKLRHLRVLSLSGYCITELPNSIGDLKRLRYLDFSQTKIKQLPESVSNLINLQTLKLYGCRKLKKLPQGTAILINLCHLDITDTDNLNEMPSCMGNLTGLQKLSKFIVGKKEGCGIEELKGLKNLQGRLSIMDLHNVIDARRAGHANLRGKHNLEELELKWSESDLKGHPSFSEIVHLELSCCSTCIELPPLGRLPSLRDLFIQGLDAVKTVGPGFYGVGSSVKPFQSLKTLKFEDMREWESWWSSAGVDEEEFPSLSELTLYSDEKLPVLSELKLEECDGVTLKYMFHKSSPTTLKLGSMSKLTCLTGHFLQSLGALKVLMISDFPNLTSLWEKGTGSENFEHPQFVSSTEIGMPSTHKSSKLSGCDKLELLPIHKVHMLLSLEDLCIETCPNLVSIPEAGLLSSLRHLVLRDCKALRSLPDGISNCPLEDLEIEECPLLKCFPGGMLPATLKSLKIRYCREFKSLPEGLMHNENGPDTLCHFDHLEIIGCPSLKSFPDGKLPTRLKTLKIWDCSQLKPLKEEMLHDDMSLQYLAISDREALSSFPECLSSFMHLTEINSSNCSALTFFPGVGLSLASLRALTIYNCKNLKSLPYEMQELTSLQKLTICSCPALESFPNGDLPPNLTSLVIWDCDGIDGCLSNWNLQSLAFLRDFSIAGQCFWDTVSFPDEKCLLPTTLTSIWIARLPNLESLSMQLRSLAYLEELEIADCPKLKSLPRECLPPALGRLCIRNCPLMTKRCSKEKGVYWPLISHIPCVEINDGNAM
ncbi:LEUCINE-RICH REPEAT-CONTAINING [Salix purpurea]|uniref:LEUCINE-RICH REPEAT-CONTAINING n=1 Tax=Salix purpurea TaxID=77065 RepID=A0A9Q0VUN3_SALPP|nr:LEUCINE-RICH REPEAT-CONTAINING [Salix purpurea]